MPHLLIFRASVEETLNSTLGGEEVPIRFPHIPKITSSLHKRSKANANQLFELAPLLVKARMMSFLDVPRALEDPGRVTQ